MVKARIWFCSWFVIGGIFEVLGYICRAVAYNLTGSLPLYIVQAAFLLLPPVFFAATLYMVYSRLVRAIHGDSLSPISLRWNTRIFVLGDFITLNIQSNGAGLLANEKLANIGNYTVISGLVVQVIIFVGFMICCWIFHRRFKAHLSMAGDATNVPWKECLYMLYGTSMAVLVRNIFRVVEYIMDKEGYLQQKEWPTFIFDSILMLFVMIAFYVWYPSDLRKDARGSMIELMSAEGSNSTEIERTAKPAESRV
ncbi:hypothetical protein FZEAL_3643 [Fusarium zealandicum]|uniref:Uncharacterized protein n=1 Tax=Fusarium zealandicum TaxID=1053134 RepID=A0A8H4UP55_9HYPO|nr:hypothetical protein FZEAL_3643 [Fusarium zealandicum]